MSEFFATKIAVQTIYRLTASYQIPLIAGQTIYTPVSDARVAQLAAQGLQSVKSPSRVLMLGVQYLRSARLKDMSKPLYSSKVAAQTIYTVQVKARLNDLAVIVLQSQKDRIIRPTPGGLMQKRIY